MITGRCETENKRIERLVEVSANESLLCSVKVYCDWMRINPHIIATCAKVGRLCCVVLWCSVLLCVVFVLICCFCCCCWVVAGMFYLLMPYHFLIYTMFKDVSVHCFVVHIYCRQPPMPLCLQIPWQSTNVVVVIVVVAVIIVVISVNGQFRYRVTTCLENLKMSGNLRAVREILQNWPKLRGTVREKISSVNTVYCWLHVLRLHYMFSRPLCLVNIFRSSPCDDVVDWKSGVSIHTSTKFFFPIST